MFKQTHLMEYLELSAEQKGPVQIIQAIALPDRSWCFCGSQAHFQNVKKEEVRILKKLGRNDQQKKKTPAGKASWLTCVGSSLYDG
jgi:hypothetical protein